MMLMALDHASLFIARVHPHEYWGAIHPQYPNFIAFFTRFISHLCAPGFFFLMGVGMALFAHSRISMGWNYSKIRRYFLIRGALLIALNHLLENPAWLLGVIGAEIPINNFGATRAGSGELIWLSFSVLFGLGSVMITSALLLRLHSFLIVGISTSCILITQGLIPSSEQLHTLYSPWLRLVFIPGRTDFMTVLYPTLPWLGITGFGIVFGQRLVQDKSRAMKGLLKTAVVLGILFLLVRSANGFGNLHPVTQYSWMDFLALNKYPPSLSFILLTLSINFLLLCLFDKLPTQKNWGQNFILSFGQSPLFFYLIHLYFYALVSLAFPQGSSYLVLYLVWGIGLLALSPLCQKYGQFKRQTPATSLWRLF